MLVSTNNLKILRRDLRFTNICFPKSLSYVHNSPTVLLFRVTPQITPFSLPFICLSSYLTNLNINLFAPASSNYNLSFFFFIALNLFFIKFILFQYFSITWLALPLPNTLKQLAQNKVSC